MFMSKKKTKEKKNSRLPYVYHTYGYVRLCGGDRGDRVDSKTVGRYCNRCACWLPREEWDLCNWKTPVDTEVKVASCIRCSERNQSSQRSIRKMYWTTQCWVFDRWIHDLRTGTRESTDHCISLENFCRDISSTHTVERIRKSMCGWRRVKWGSQLPKRLGKFSVGGTLWKTDR